MVKAAQFTARLRVASRVRILKWRRRQKRRNPLRCQPMTVSGFTMISADRQSVQNRDSHAQRNRSEAISFGRFTDRCITPS